ncbi:MAG: EAL domain-containing protein [Proteobacteria bacterium]|nr:EAL domain-containing protein [Pseudomonadota bacterium]
MSEPTEADAIVGNAKRVALLVGIIVLVALPGGYFDLKYAHRIEHVETVAETKARAIHALVNANPEVWMYQLQRIEDIIRQYPVSLNEDQVTVRDAAGNVLTTLGVYPVAPVLVREAPIYDSARLTGYVEITHSYRDVMLGTFAVGLMSLLLSVMVYAAMLAPPLRAVRRLRAVNAALLIEQDALRESRERFDLAIRGSSVGVWDWNVRTGDIFVSDRWCELMGYAPGEIVVGTNTWSEWIHPEDVEVAIDQMRQHFRLRTRYDSEYRIRVKSGEYRWFHNRGQAIWNAEGTAIRLAGSTSDITERRRSEDELRLNELALESQNSLVTSLLKNLPVGVFMVEAPSGRPLMANDEAVRLLGRGILPDASRETLAEVYSAYKVGASDYYPVEEMPIVLGMNGVTSHVEDMLVERPDGTKVLLEVFGSPMVDDRGQIYASLVSFIDITERKDGEDQLRKLSFAVEQSPESIIITNLDGDIEYVNEAFVKKTGYSREEAIGKNPRILHSGKTPPEAFAALWETLTQGKSWKGEFHNRRKDGSEYTEHAVIMPIHWPDGRITHYVAVKEDVTAKKAAALEINTLAFYDPLTSLPNRRLLLDRLKQALASSNRNKRYGALLFIDLDNFKTLNDTLGHDIGDLLLQQVAQRLTICVREGDTVARLGGDEFVVMLEDLSENMEESAAQTKTVGEKILSTLNQSYQLGRYPHLSTPSIGVTLFADQQETIDELLKRADLAMYQAKAAGRNTLRFFDPEMQSVVTARAALEADLREALLKSQFLLHYQAQVVGEGRVTGVEVLLRWQHPQRGMVSPADFIPLAEDTGLILPLGHWVLQTACSQLTLWAARPEMAHLTIAVNVSARQFHHKDFVGQVVAVLDATGANPNRLKLELTESLLVDDVESIIAKMATLKMKGVGFSLDDFGTGYSSLSYLKRLPLDQLKIDQGFVRDILTDANDASIAKMVVVLAESLGLSVIAEGVEMEAQRDFLARHGCHAYQGYLFSRPLPLDQFEDFALKV